ncbi:MAG: fibronectin type III domain-containing protein, partial [Arachnia sp.]
QQVRYQVTDVDGITAQGLVLVPGRGDSVPVLRDPLLELEAVAGEPITVTLNDLVAGTADRSVRLTGVDTVTATNGRAVPGQDSIDYISDEDYLGPASLVFEVTDIVPDGNTSAKRAYISIPITVVPPPDADESAEDLAAANSAPELAGPPPVLSVGAGEEEARLDLQPLFHDAEGDSFYFTDFAAAGGSSAIEWGTSTDGNFVLGTTPIGTEPGTTRTIRAAAIDANDGRTEFEIRLEVVSSTKPLPTVVADVIPNAVAGQESMVSPLDNDSSHLASDPTLTLLSAKVIAGDGTARVEGDRVAVTPAQGFVGTITVAYTVVDATGDPSRRVDGTIRGTVSARPSRPGTPRDIVVGNGSVTFTYTPGSPNGLPIEQRLATPVLASGRELDPVECGSTTCTVTGLSNGTAYQFKVAEVNQAGTSDPSPLSAIAVPDVIPNPPGRPSVSFDDSQLTATWAAPTWDDPANPGSPVRSYRLALLSEGGAQLEVRELGPGSLSYTWNGLSNGRRYRFAVEAVNEAGSSGYSEASAVEWPAGPPGAPPGIVATPTTNELGGRFEIAVSAAGIATNGDPVRSFVVTPVAESGPVTSKAVTVDAAGSGSVNVAIDGLGEQPYRFQVVAYNKHPRPGAATTTSSWQRAWRLPEVTSARAGAGDGSIQIDVTHNFETRTEASPQVQYRINGGGWQSLPDSGNVAASNGVRSEVEVRVVLADGQASAAVSAGAVTPRSAVPTWPGLDESDLRFTGAAVEGLLQVSSSLPGSGGWDLAGYQFRCTEPTSCRFGSGNSWNSSSQFRIDASGWSSTINVRLEARHTDSSQTKSYAMSLPPPLSSSWDPGTSRLSITMRYVRDASCWVDDDSSQGTTITQNGATTLSGTATLEFADPPPTVRVHCSSSRFSDYTFLAS